MRAKLLPDAPWFFFRRSVKVRRLPTVIGRGCDSDIRLDDPLVSRKHCEINEVHGALVVRDLGSTNGTLVNDSAIHEAPLLPGDKLTIGTSQFLASYRLRLRSSETSGGRGAADNGDEQCSEAEVSASSALS